MFANKEIIEDGRCGERAEIEDILKELSAIRAEMVAAPDLSRPRLDEVHSNYRESARNFLQYLALRRHDLRPLQLRLAALGLSSLGRAESHVLATVDAVMEVLSRLADPSWQKSSEMAEIFDFTKGQQLLSEHTETLFGPAPKGRGVRIMVTMPSEAAENYLLVHNLLQQALRVLDDILQREQSHHSKKRSMLRHLILADHFPGKP